MNHSCIKLQESSSGIRFVNGYHQLHVASGYLIVTHCPFCGEKLSTYSKDWLDEQFGTVSVKFARYYKYVFTYNTVHNGHILECDYGGDRDLIYRFDVRIGSSVLYTELNWKQIRLFDASGVLLFEWS